MGIRDFHSNHSLVEGFAPEALTATKNGTGVDRQGYHAIEHVVQVGVGGITFTTANKIELILEDSADNTTFAAVTAAADVLQDASDDNATAIDANGIFKAITAAHAAGVIYRIGYRGKQRYSRVVAKFSGTHAAGTPVSANAIKSAPSRVPV